MSANSGNFPEKYLYKTPIVIDGDICVETVLGSIIMFKREDIIDIGLYDENLFLYDPAYKEHNTLPDRTFDGVISTDVLEHIPEEVIPKTLYQIFERAKKFVYLAICTRLANAILPNGENAHCTVKEPDWWEKHIIKSNKNKIHTEVHWYGNHNDYRKYYTSS